MGTICILLGLIIFLGSLFLGFIAANALQSSMITQMFTWVPTGIQFYAIVIGICGFIGLLICLNLVMHGLTYNKVCKLARKGK